MTGNAMADGEVRVGRRRGGLGALGLLIALVLVGLVFFGGTDDGGEPADDEAAEPTPTRRPAPTATPSPTPEPLPPETTPGSAGFPAAEGTLLAVADPTGIRVVDLGDGSVAQLSERPSPYGPVVALESGIAAQTGNQRLRLFPFEPGADPVDLGPAWDAFAVGPDSLWLVYAPGPEPPELTQVTADGTELAVIPTVEIGSFFFGGFGGRGPPVLAAGGGLYAIAPDGSRRWLGVGQLVGIGPNHALVRTCDEQFECRLAVADLATGERTEAPGLDSESGSSLGIIAPDGSGAVMLDGFAGRLAVVDFGAGEVVHLESRRDYLNSGQVSWDPSSRWVYVVVGALVLAVEPRSGDATELPIEVGAGGRIAAFEG